MEAITIGDSPYDAMAAKQTGRCRVLECLAADFPSPSLRAAWYSEIYRDCADLLENYERSMIVDRKAA